MRLLKYNMKQSFMPVNWSASQREVLPPIRQHVRTIRKCIFVLITAVMAAGGMSGCTRESGDLDSGIYNTKGTISMSGSTSMEMLANALAEEYMNKYKGVNVTVEFAGSSAGIEAVINGMVDIGNASRSLKESEIKQGAVENIVAIDGIVVIVDKNNVIEDITKENLAAIFKGEIRNWKELGGDDVPIVVVGREAGSGTRGAFEELLGIEDQCRYANEYNNTGAVIAKAASTKGVIGYVSLDVIDDTIKALSIEGAEANESNIKSGIYILSRPFVMATYGEILEKNDLIKELFEYIRSDEGKEIIERVGLITPD